MRYLIILLTLPLLISCQDSYLVKKIQEMKGDNKTPPVTQAPKEKSPPIPPAPTEAPAPQAQNPEDNPVNQFLYQGNNRPSLPLHTSPKAPEKIVERRPSNPNEAIEQEISGYIQCLNRTQNRVISSKNRYLSWVDEATGPNCKERYIIYKLYPLYEDGVGTCQKAASGEGGADPSLAGAQAAAKELAQAYAVLVPMVQDIYDYYDQEDYRDDNCAKAKSTHPKLMAQFNAYESALNKLKAQIEPVQDRLLVEKLQFIETTEGKKLPWHIQKVLLSGRHLQKLIPEDAKATWNSPKYLSAFGEFEIDYKNFEDYEQKHPEEVETFLIFSSFSSSAKQFYTQAKKVKRDLQDQNSPKAREAERTVDYYNSMINRAKNIRRKSF